MPSRVLSNPPALHDAPGYSHIATTNAKTLVFLAGQVALDKNFELIGGDDLYEQTKAAAANVVTALESVGATFDDVVRRTIYTTQPSEYELMTRAIEEVTGSTDHSPQTVLGVTALGLPELLIEIECTAAIE